MDINLKDIMGQKKSSTAQKVKRWDKVLSTGKTKVTGKAKGIVAELIDNTVRHDMASQSNKGLFSENQAGYGTPSINTDLGTQPIAKTWNVTIPTLKRIFPKLLANELVSVQPIDSPYSLVFVMKYFNTKAGAGYASDKELYNPSLGFKESTTNKAGDALNFTDATYSGYNAVEIHDSYSTQSGENLGGWLSDIYGTVQYEEASIGFDVQEVKAKTNAIKSQLSVEFQQDLEAMRGEDAEATLIDLMTENIQSDNDRRIIAEIKRTAISGEGGSTLPWVLDMGALTTADARWKQEKNAYMLEYLGDKALEVQEKTFSGQANWLLGNRPIINALKHTATQYVNGEFTVSAGYEGSDAYKGDVDGMKCYMDIYTKYHEQGGSKFNEVTLGLNGGNLGDSGVIFSPYVPMMITKGAGIEDGQTRIMLKSRNGIVRNSLNGGAYYSAGLIQDI